MSRSGQCAISVTKPVVRWVQQKAKYLSGNRRSDMLNKMSMVELENVNGGSYFEIGELNYTFKSMYGRDVPHSIQRKRYYRDR